MPPIFVLLPGQDRRVEAHVCRGSDVQPFAQETAPCERMSASLHLQRPDDPSFRAAGAGSLQGLCVPCVSLHQRHDSSSEHSRRGNS